MQPWQQSTAVLFCFFFSPSFPHHSNVSSFVQLTLSTPLQLHLHFIQNLPLPNKSFISATALPPAYAVTSTWPSQVPGWHLHCNCIDLAQLIYPSSYNPHNPLQGSANLNQTHRAQTTIAHPLQITESRRIYLCLLIPWCQMFCLLWWRVRTGQYLLQILGASLLSQLATFFSHLKPPGTFSSSTKARTVEQWAPFSPHSGKKIGFPPIKKIAINSWKLTKEFVANIGKLMEN